MRRAHTWGWGRTRRYDEPSNDPGPSSSRPSGPDCITATREYDFREGHPRHDWAGMQAHPDWKRDRQPRSQSPGGRNHLKRELRRHPGVIGAWRRYAGDCHVVVADRLDLFDPGIFGELVEFAEQLIQASDDFIGLHACRDLTEANGVGKNNGGIIKMIGDVAFPLAQACHDFSRQNVP